LAITDSYLNRYFNLRPKGLFSAACFAALLLSKSAQLLYAISASYPPAAGGTSCQSVATASFWLVN
jgi:hypothetical protein